MCKASKGVAMNLLHAVIAVAALFIAVGIAAVFMGREIKNDPDSKKGWRR